MFFQYFRYSNKVTKTSTNRTYDTTQIQTITGALLYYSRIVDPTIRVALSWIASEATKPTVATSQHLTQLLEYLATQPNPSIRFTNPDMQL